MAKVKFTSALNKFFPDLRELEISAPTIQQVIHEVNVIFPGIENYLLEEDGSLRQHVNIFIHEDLISDRVRLSDEVRDGDKILIYQALSGG